MYARTNLIFSCIFNGHLADWFFISFSLLVSPILFCFLYDELAAPLLAHFQLNCT